MPVDPGHPITDPTILVGALNVARTHVQIVLVLPHALPPNTHMLHPDDPVAGSETKVTFTVGTVVSYGLGFPLKRTPAWPLVQR